MPSQPATKAGRPPYQPTDKDRTLVRLLCAGGILQDRIAAALDISEPTLRKHYKRDIRVGATEIDGLAIGSLVKAMRAGGKEAVTAAKWWSQSRMGWREPPTEIANADDKPFAVSFRWADPEKPTE